MELVFVPEPPAPLRSNGLDYKAISESLKANAGMWAKIATASTADYARKTLGPDFHVVERRVPTDKKKVDVWACYNPA